MSVETSESSNSEHRNDRIAELIHPRNLPEAGFQSYEELKNDAVAQKQSFLDGDVRNPALTYSRFYNLSDMDKGILALADVAEKVDHIETDSEKAAVTRYSLEFRMAEMSYIKLLAQLDFLCKEGGSDDEIRVVLEDVRELNEQLYGKPDPKIVDAARQAVWLNLDSKSYAGSAEGIYKDLSEGFAFRDARIEPFARPENPESQLPDFNHESLSWAGEHILEVNNDIEALVHEFWEAKVAENGEDYVCPPEDIVEAFEWSLALMDPEGTSGVGVVLDQDATALSWESPLMAVKVGAKRPPIETQEELFAKILHELKVHGGRSISGLKTSIPVLGTGFYTDTPRPDYLTFEEGFATTVEEVIRGEEPKWDGAKLGHYINISMAQEGHDFRTVFETSWRYRLLMDLEDNQEVNDEMIEKAKSSTYTACVRIFRGTQTTLQERLPDSRPLTFNKDLAYLEGRVIAMQHIAELHSANDIAGLDRLFKAKYDPTIPVQNRLVMAEFPD